MLNIKKSFALFMFLKSSANINTIDFNAFYSCMDSQLILKPKKKLEMAFQSLELTPGTSLQYLWKQHPQISKKVGGRRGGGNILIPFLWYQICINFSSEIMYSEYSSTHNKVINIASPQHLFLCLPKTKNKKIQVPCTVCSQNTTITT